MLILCLSSGSSMFFSFRFSLKYSVAMLVSFFFFRVLNIFQEFLAVSRSWRSNLPHVFRLFCQNLRNPGLEIVEEAIRVMFPSLWGCFALEYDNTLDLGIYAFRAASGASWVFRWFARKGARERTTLFMIPCANRRKSQEEPGHEAALRAYPTDNSPIY